LESSVLTNKYAEMEGKVAFVGWQTVAGAKALF